jgi:hypothetical protein
MSRQVHGFHSNTARFNCFAILNSDINTTGRECFMVKKPATPLISGSHGFRRDPVRNQLHIPFLQLMCCTCMVKMGMGQETVSNVVWIQSPIFYISENLVEGIPTAAVEHNKPLARIQHITVGIVEADIYACPGDAVQIAPNLVEIF